MSLSIAIKRVQATVKDGYRIAVDIDLAKFFDTVNHDVLMSLLGRAIRDRRLLGLIEPHRVSRRPVGLSQTGLA
jgi:retron-type reverse transcriptase